MCKMIEKNGIAQIYLLIFAYYSYMTLQPNKQLKLYGIFTLCITLQNIF